MPKIDRTYHKRRRAGRPRKQQQPPQPEVPSNVFVVERIVDKRFNELWNRVEYLIKWESYPSEENTWEPTENIIDQSVIRAFETQQYMSRIVGRRTIKGQIEYLVEWKGDEKKTTWEIPNNIYHQSLITAYEKRKRIEINLNVSNRKSSRREDTTEDDSTEEESSDSDDGQDVKSSEPPKTKENGHSDHSGQNELDGQADQAYQESHVSTQTASTKSADVEEQMSQEEEAAIMSAPEDHLPSPQQPAQENIESPANDIGHEITPLEKMQVEGQEYPIEVKEEPIDKVKKPNVEEQAMAIDSTSSEILDGQNRPDEPKVESPEEGELKIDLDDQDQKAEIDLNNNAITPPKLEDVSIKEEQAIMNTIEEAPGQIVAEVLAVVHDNSEKMVANDIVLDKVELIESAEQQQDSTIVATGRGYEVNGPSQQARWDLLLKDAERQLAAGTILGSAKRNQKRVYLIEWANGGHQVLSELEVKRDWPQMLIQFYEKNINWIRNDNCTSFG